MTARVCVGGSGHTCQPISIAFLSWIGLALSQWSEEDELADYKQNSEWMEECQDGLFETWYDKIAQADPENQRKVSRVLPLLRFCRAYLFKGGTGREALSLQLGGCRVESDSSDPPRSCFNPSMSERGTQPPTVSGP